MFGIWYMVSPRFCHRFVGYLEEEAVKTYTKCLEVCFFFFLKHLFIQAKLCYKLYFVTIALTGCCIFDLPDGF